MNLKRLQAFVAVYDTRSVTAAAHRLHSTQPAVSRLINDLEGELGLSLFLREKRRLIPTSEGRAFYSESRTALAAVDQIINIARDLRTLKGAHVRIVAPMLTAFGFLPSAIATFRARHPSARVSVEIKDLRDIADWVANGPFDIGVTALPFDDDRVECEVLTRVKQVLVLPNDHRLTRQRAIKLSALAEEHLILPSGDPPRSTILSAFEKAGLDVNSSIDTSSAFSVCQLVANGLGLGIVDPYTFHLTKGWGIASRPLDPSIEYPFGFFFPKHRPRSAHVSAFVDAVRSTIKARMRSK